MLTLRAIMRAVWIIAVVMAVALAGGVLIVGALPRLLEPAERLESPTESASNEDIVCYPESLDENERKLGIEVPCAPRNYLHVPLINIQKDTFHDRNGIWEDDEVWNPDGSWVWDNTVKVDATEATVTMVTGGMCGTLSTCPVKIRIRKSGQPDEIYGWPKMGLLCADVKYYFIRDDFKELLACGKHYPLD